MRETLIDLVMKAGLTVVSVVGLAKNTGKTTTLLYLVDALGKPDGGLALTSTGRDGEAVDEITQKEKPRVTIGPGVIATTSESSFRRGEGLSLVCRTPYRTATGAILIVRAEDKAQVILEGPATVAQTGELADLLIRDEGARRVIIDGSLDRIAVAAPHISEGIVLAAGAVMAPDIATAAAKTRHVVNIFMTKKTSLSLPDPPEFTRYYAVAGEKGAWEIHRGSGITDLSGIMKAIRGGAGALFLSGALSDRVLSTLLEVGKTPVVIVSDPTKLFVSERTFALYTAAGGKIEVAREIRLIAVTINPHNPEGVDFDPDHFLETMRITIPDVPVFDIVREERRAIETRS